MFLAIIGGCMKGQWTNKLTKFKSLALFQNLPAVIVSILSLNASSQPLRVSPNLSGNKLSLTSPHPLHGYASSSPALSGYSPAATAASGASMAHSCSYSQLRAGCGCRMGVGVTCVGVCRVVCTLVVPCAWVGVRCEVI